LGGGAGHLRRAILLIAAALLVVSLVLVRADVLPGWWLPISSAILLAALLFDRRSSPNS
jgi:hypothetical protein